MNTKEDKHTISNTQIFIHTNINAYKHTHKNTPLYTKTHVHKLKTLTLTTTNSHT